MEQNDFEDCICDGKDKFFSEKLYGTIEQCPNCEHYNMFYHCYELDDLDYDNDDNWIGYCGCCGYIDSGVD